MVVVINCSGGSGGGGGHNIFNEKLNVYFHSSYIIAVTLIVF